MDNMQRIKEIILKMSWGKYKYEEELGDQKWHQHFWSFASSAFSFCNFVLIAKVPLVLHCWHFYGDVIANWIAPTNKILNDIFPFHRNDLRIVSSPNCSMLRSHHLHIAPSLDGIWISFLFLKKNLSLGWYLSWFGSLTTPNKTKTISNINHFKFAYKPKIKLKKLP